MAAAEAVEEEVTASVGGAGSLAAMVVALDAADRLAKNVVMRAMSAGVKTIAFLDEGRV